MKTDATLTCLLQEMPALTADLEGRLHGGFCAFCDTDSFEEIAKDNTDCNCNCKGKSKSKGKKNSRPSNPDCNCNCECKSNDSRRRKAQTGFTLSF